MKHEQLLEGLLTAEEKERDEEEAVMAKVVGKVFAEKREKIRRLEDVLPEVRGRGQLTCYYHHIPNAYRKLHPLNNLELIGLSLQVYIRSNCQNLLSGRQTDYRRTRHLWSLLDPVRWVVGRMDPPVMDPLVMEVHQPKGDLVCCVTTVTVVVTVIDVIILPINISTEVSCKPNDYVSSG